MTNFTNGKIDYETSSYDSSSSDDSISNDLSDTAHKVELQKPSEDSGDCSSSSLENSSLKNTASKGSRSDQMSGIADDVVDFSYSPAKNPSGANNYAFEIIPYNNPDLKKTNYIPDDAQFSSSYNIMSSDQSVLVSADSERQILLLMLLAQVCALHDATPRTFTVHVLSLFERGILDQHSIRFLFDLGLVPQDALADFNAASPAATETAPTTMTRSASAVLSTSDQVDCVQEHNKGVRQEIIPQHHEDLTVMSEIIVDRPHCCEYSGAIIPYFPPLTASWRPQRSTSQTSADSSIGHDGHQQQLQSASSFLQQQQIDERRAREASVSAIKKVLERHDSNESSMTRHSTTCNNSANRNQISQQTASSAAEGTSISLNNGASATTVATVPPVNACHEPVNEVQEGITEAFELSDHDDGASNVSSTTPPKQPHDGYQTHLPSAVSPPASWSVEHHPLSLSRYQREFVQIRLLASGSFGEVYHAVNKFDQRDYAIKRVLFTATGFSNDTVHLVMREVRCLAQCDHPNCVRYYTSWLEPSWMTGSGLPIAPDQIVSRSTQRKLLTDIHQLVLTHEELEHEIVDEDSIVSKENAHLHHIDELLFGGRHRQLLQSTAFSQNQSKRYLSTSHEGSEESDRSECSNDDVTIGRNEPYYSDGGGSSIGFTFQESTKGGGRSRGPRITSIRDVGQVNSSEQQTGFSSTTQNSFVHTRSNSNNTNRYKYHICLFIQMQLCHSSTLADWIRRRNSNSHKENGGVIMDMHQWAFDAYQVFRQIVCGLAHVHGKGIIHRDLKPANIFAADDGVFKIGDFGLSKLLMKTSSTTQSSNTHDRRYSTPLGIVDDEYWEEAHTVGVGTASYASPEQVNSEDYGPEVDIFSLGLILLELCSNFGTEHERAQAFHDVRIARMVPRRVQRLFPRAAAHILACTEPDPQNRPSAHDILSDDIFQESNTEILRLKVELRKKELTLERQQTLLTEKDRMIEDLRRQLLQFQHKSRKSSDEHNI